MQSLTSMVRAGELELIGAVLEVLEQAEELVEWLGDDHYTAPVPVAYNATIGGHVRHCLDHFRALLSGLDSFDLNYDRRERGTLVERDRFAALNEVRALREAYAGLSVETLERVLHVASKASYAVSRSQAAVSTFGRELMYCVAHAVHHHALIGVMARLLNVPLPAGFGVAPSTLHHRAQAQAQAQTQAHPQLQTHAEASDPIARGTDRPRNG